MTLLSQGKFKKRRPPTLPHCIAVPSAQAGLTSLFGMGRGGTPPLSPPDMGDMRTLQTSCPVELTVAIQLKVCAGKRKLSGN